MLPKYPTSAQHAPKKSHYLIKNGSQDEKTSGITYRILSFLTPKELLRFRMACRNAEACKDVARCRSHFPGPYLDKHHFMLTVFGELRTPSKRFRKRDAGTAFYLYSVTRKHASPGEAAVLYKLSDTSKFKGKLPDISSERLLAWGRQYDPPSDREHTLPINLVWLLAQIHMGRSFFVISALKPENIMRKNSPEEYSAFSKELGAAYKAGYRPTKKDHRGFFYLEPTISLENMRKLTMADVNPTNQEIDVAIEAIKPQLDQIPILRPVPKTAGFFQPSAEVKSECTAQAEPVAQAETGRTEPRAGFFAGVFMFFSRLSEPQITSGRSCRLLTHF